MPVNPKQERFCQEYLLDLNATQAAIRTGYSESTARHQASRLLADVNIRTRVQELMKIRSENLLVDVGFVIESLVDNVNRCRQSKEVLEWNHDTKEFVGTGEFQFDSTGANKALELLGKHLGAFEKDNAQKAQLAMPLSDDQFQTLRKEAREAATHTSK